MSITTYLGTPPIDDKIAKTIDELYQMRLETLLSVDDLVAAVVKALEVGLLKQQTEHHFKCKYIFIE